MIVVFDDPKNEGHEREFKFDMDDLDVQQARRIKRDAGLTPKKLMDALEEGDPDALVALYWLMLNQNGISADMHKLNFKIAKFGEALNNAAQAEREAQEAVAEENPTADATTASS